MWWVVLALASERDDVVRHWEALHDARLVEALDGTPEVAAMYYQEMLQDLDGPAGTPGANASVDDPKKAASNPAMPAASDPGRDTLHAETSYWLARSRYELGDIPGALAALKRAAQDPAVRPAALALVGLIEADLRREGGLPVDHRFEEGLGPFVIGEGGQGSLDVERTEQGGVLRWRDEVRTGAVTHIDLPLSPSVPLHSLSFRVRAVGLPADLQVTVQDGAGRRFAAPMVRVPVDTWVVIELGPESFRPLVGAGPMGRISRVQLENLTGYLSPARGAQALQVDDFRLD